MNKAIGRTEQYKSMQTDGVQLKVPRKQTFIGCGAQGLPYDWRKHVTHF